MSKGMPLHHALAWILGSTIVVNGGAFMLMRPFFKWKNSRLDSDAPITAIVQTGPESQALKSVYFAELLSLSADEPTLVLEFSTKKAKEILLSSPVIQRADIKLVPPGIVYIDYTVRKPVALLGDFENLAIDAEGFFFPVSPFFSPKNLPEIYLGLDALGKWNAPLRGEKVALAFELLHAVTGPAINDVFNVKRIDVSKAFDSSFGRREVVLFTEDEVFKGSARYFFPRALRLTASRYRQELGNYIRLRERLVEAEEGMLPSDGRGIQYFPCKIIDFRIPQLAFIDEKGAE